MTGIEFCIGDLVTRDGTDIHRVVGFEGEGDLIVVECVKEPDGFMNEDGTHGPPWTRKGERESNLPSRYRFAGREIEGTTLPATP